MERKTAKITIGISVLLLLIGACSLYNRHDKTADYSSEKQAYTKKIGQYLFTLKPYSSQKLANVNYSGSNLSAAAKDSIVKEYDDYLCFIMEINIDGFSSDISDYELPGKKTDYEKRVGYYLFGMQNDLKLAGKDYEIPCSIYYCERMNEIVKTNRFIVGFRKGDSGDMTLEYSNPYLDCGKVKFSIDKDLLALN